MSSTTFLALAVSAGTVCGTEQPTSHVPLSKWLQGPATVKLSEAATLGIPGDCVFLNRSNTLSLLDEMQCLTSGFEMGLIASKSDGWSVVVEVRDVGYVSDADWVPPAARSLLSAIVDATEQSNGEREQNGWAAVHVRDWVTAPTYDATNHSIQWAVKAESDGARLVNRTIAVLFRRGFVRFVLVDQHERQGAAEALSELVRGLEFTTGMQYGAGRPGDNLALGGLTSVILGTSESDFTWTELDEALADAGRPALASSQWWLVGTLATLLGFVAGRRFSHRGRRVRHRPTRLNQIKQSSAGSAPPSPATKGSREMVIESVETVSAAHTSNVQGATTSRRRHRRFDAYSFHQRLIRDLHWTLHR